jgi:hypothetical protein
MLNRRLKSVAAADRRHPKMQTGVAGMPAFIHQLLGSLMALTNLQKLIRIRMALAKVGAKSALTVLYVRHRVPDLLSLGLRHTPLLITLFAVLTPFRCDRNVAFSVPAPHNQSH